MSVGIKAIFIGLPHWTCPSVIHGVSGVVEALCLVRKLLVTSLGGIVTGLHVAKLIVRLISKFRAGSKVIKIAPLSFAENRILKFCLIHLIPIRVCQVFGREF